MYSLRKLGYTTSPFLQQIKRHHPTDFPDAKIRGHFFKKTDDSQSFTHPEHELYQELTTVQKQKIKHRMKSSIFYLILHQNRQK
jgi:hypothetical protein